MARNPVLDLPLSDIMRSEIALPLQHVLHIYTVGSFLKAWRNPRSQRNIEAVFDTPQQARHAVTVCAAWLGVRSSSLTLQPIAGGWWTADESPRLVA